MEVIEEMMSEAWSDPWTYVLNRLIRSSHSETQDWKD